MKLMFDFQKIPPEAQLNHETYVLFSKNPAGGPTQLWNLCYSFQKINKTLKQYSKIFQSTLKISQSKLFTLLTPKMSKSKLFTLLTPKNVKIEIVCTSDPQNVQNWLGQQFKNLLGQQSKILLRPGTGRLSPKIVFFAPGAQQKSILRPGLARTTPGKAPEIKYLIIKKI